MKRRVFVGLSGGVDSAVSAALLQDQGYDVTGVFIKIWQPEFTECTWKEDRLDAMRVTAALNIPFKEIDLSEKYRKNVVDTMVADYARGITPNPDVLCNRHIKFGAFAQWCVKNGADYVATGHYARIAGDAKKGFQLLRGADDAKDQSYFLYRLNQRDLARALFPIGSMQKSEVRAYAKKRGLPVAHKADSQGLCFVGHITMQEFLARYITLAPGPVMLDGVVIGEHNGAALYTLGQRHGFTNNTNDLAPHYVIRTDVATNTIYVSAHRDDATRKTVHLRDVHWIHQEPPLPNAVTVQARYHGERVLARITRERGRVYVTFETPHIAAPGQSVVMYDGDVCLGGGIVCE